MLYIQPVTASKRSWTYNFVPARCLSVCLCVQALTILSAVLPRVESDRENALNVIARTWIAKYDVDEGNRQLADQ